jgi:hypothetical protein
MVCSRSGGFDLKKLEEGTPEMKDELASTVGYDGIGKTM